MGNLSHRRLSDTTAWRPLGNVRVLEDGLQAVVCHLCNSHKISLRPQLPHLQHTSYYLVLLCLVRQLTFLL